MPSPERDNSARLTFPPAADSVAPADPRVSELRTAALEVLLAPELAGAVDLVAWRDGGVLFVANATGKARAIAGGEFEVLDGRQPIPSQDPLHGVPLAAAVEDPSPPNARNSYPDAA
ncbi:MAG: type phosphodiesterase/nucleotide pyrophosphatase, partial [Mycobacterium sp.]|nr:type phosphodiesterase/nucleotide pyrophosphatase [Mycobacterium sp.]